MKEFSEDLGLLTKEASKIVKSSYTLIKLKTILKISILASTLLNWGISIFLIFTIFIFSSIGLSEWIGNLLGKTYYGFFVISGVYFMILLLFKLFFAKIIKKKIQNIIINKIL